jgi:hypothetical protein
MDTATESRPARALLPALLAGLEAGMVGGLWMLAWLGVSSSWQQRSFWTPENLMATAFDRNATLPPGFTFGTCQGLALYLVIYCLFGALFAVVVGNRAARPRVLLLSVTCSLAWYYFTFRWAFTMTMPLVALLHVERSTILGHLVYGAMLGRYPVYIQRLAGNAEAAPLASTAAEDAAVAVETAAVAVEDAVMAVETAAVAVEAMDEQRDAPPQDAPPAEL